MERTYDRLVSRDRKELDQIVRILRGSTTFFISGHLKPDGDTVGCSLALASMLKRMGKKVYLFTHDPVPENLSFLRGWSGIRTAEHVARHFDCAIILECSSFDRMGAIIGPRQARSIINIDHHTHVGSFGDVNFIDSQASSSAEQVARLFRFMKLTPTVHEAEALYVGLVTDTGRFQQANASVSAFDTAAWLLECGVKPTRVYEHLYADKTLSSLKLLGLALQTLTLNKTKDVALFEVTLEMYRSSGSDVTETEAMINYAMMVPTVMVGVMFREDEGRRTIKVGFRSKDAFDVNKAASHFGGGGHRNASGCTIKGSLREAKQKVLAYIEKTVV